jgi:uncharacterized protein YcbK (DUF882 family)
MVHSRRAFLAAGLAALPGLAGIPRRLQAAAVAGPATGPGVFGTGPRALDLVHTHTGERLAVEYFTGGAYVPDAMEEVDRFLRDFRTGDVHPIDPHTLDILAGLRSLTGGRAPYEIISGYRSAQTNALLRARSDGVAANSLHLVGKAIDLRLPGVPLARLRDAALALRRGGVGYYPASRFIHLDTGRVRRW